MKKELLYEGKAKKVFLTQKENVYIVEYKDDATAFNGEKKDVIAGKGPINNQVSSILFSFLEEKGIPTHFLENIDKRHMRVKAVKIIPLEVIVRNVSAGSFSRRLGVKEGSLLKKPVLEFCLKDDALGDPLINEDHVLALELATKEEIQTIKKYAQEINAHLSAFFKARNLLLVDFKLEFGIFEGSVILADEISPDTCRLWDKKTGEKRDKDRFRQDLGDVMTGYEDVLSRVSRS